MNYNNNTGLIEIKRRKKKIKECREIIEQEDPNDPYSFKMQIKITRPKLLYLQHGDIIDPNDVKIISKLNRVIHAYQESNTEQELSESGMRNTIHNAIDISVRYGHDINAIELNGIDHKGRKVVIQTWPSNFKKSWLNYFIKPRRSVWVRANLGLLHDENGQLIRDDDGRLELTQGYTDKFNILTDDLPICKKNLRK